MVDHKAGLLHQRTDPAHTMIAIIGVLIEIVANRNPLDGHSCMSMRKTSSVACIVYPAAFVRRGYVPVFLHALESPCVKIRFAGVTLRVVVDRVVPIIAQRSCAAGSPATQRSTRSDRRNRKHPIMHASLMSARNSAKDHSAFAGMNRLSQDPIPATMRTVSPAGAAMASLTK